MAYSITFSGAGADATFSLCSIGAWGEFCEWAGTLPDDFQAVKTLATEGEVLGTDKLAEQLKAARKRFRPADGVYATVRSMLKDIGEGDPAETATIED